MTEYIFRLKEGCAQLIRGDSTPVDQAVLRLEDGRQGAVLLGGHRIEITEQGAHLSAQNFKSGLYPLLIHASGMRYEGPRIAVYSNTLCFLPPTHERMARAEDRILETEEKIAALEKRVFAIEHHIQSTHIF